MIPIGTDYRMSRRPWVNYALVGINVVLFFLNLNSATPENAERIKAWMLQPDAPYLYQFLSSMFLHGDFWHLAGNMVFLWVFGNGINDRLGHVGYLSFYLAGGIIAGVGYMLVSPRAPVLGASGAISAVTGAYLVLLPRTRVTVLMVLFYVLLPLEITSLVFLALQFGFNLLMSGTQATGVAYSAHSAGYVFGIAAATGLLATKLLPRDAYDLLNLVRNWRRRSRYRRMVARGYDPFTGTRPGGQDTGRKWVPSRPAEGEPSSRPANQREQDLRTEIAEACERHDTATAARKYLELVQIADDAVLARQNQLDVANQLMSKEQYPAAADAYERFLRHYGNYEYLGEIHLMLGLIYGRYLHQYERAEQCLSAAVERLNEPKKVELARNELSAVRRNRWSG